MNAETPVRLQVGNMPPSTIGTIDTRFPNNTTRSLAELLRLVADTLERS